MCGRFSQSYTWQEMYDSYNLIRPSTPQNLEPRYNIAPTQWVQVVRHAEDGNELNLMYWGLVPFFWKKPLSEKKFSSFNARSETVATTNSYRGPYKYRRCIIPVSGFYEWQRPKRKGQAPIYFKSRTDGILSLAALWDEWADPQSSDILESCTIVTTQSNEVVKPYHDRMPVILTQEQGMEWMTTPPEKAHKLSQIMKPCSPEMLTAYRVSPAVNNVRHEDADCIKPLKEDLFD